MLTAEREALRPFVPVAKHAEFLRRRADNVAKRVAFFDRLDVIKTIGLPLKREEIAALMWEQGRLLAEAERIDLDEHEAFVAGLFHG